MIMIRLYAYYFVENRAFILYIYMCDISIFYMKTLTLYFCVYIPVCKSLQIKKCKELRKHIVIHFIDFLPL